MIVAKAEESFYYASSFDFVIEAAEAFEYPKLLNILWNHENDLG